MAESSIPDWHLVVVSSVVHGPIDFAAPGWRSPQSKVIAASRLRDMQESMLLMKPDDWVRTSCGFWQLSASVNQDFGAELKLREEDLVF